MSSLLKQIIEQIDDDSKISGLFSLAELFNMEFVVDVFYIYHSGYSNESPVLHVSYDLELNKETKVIEVDNQLTLKKKTDDSDDSDDSDDNEHINWADYKIIMMIVMMVLKVIMVMIVIVVVIVNLKTKI